MASSVIKYDNPQAVPAYAIPNNSDLNNFKTAGVYRVVDATSAATMTNIPTTVSGGRLEVLAQYNASTYLRQMYYPATQYYFTRLLTSGGVWGPWEIVSTMVGPYTMTSNTTKTFNVPNNSRHMCYLFSAGGQSLNGAFMICAAAAGTTVYQPLNIGSNLTITHGTNTVTIQVGSGNVYLYAQLLAGSPITEASS